GIKDDGVANCRCNGGSPTTELCNGIDDDCDTLIDEGTACCSNADSTSGYCTAVCDKTSGDSGIVFGSYLFDSGGEVASKGDCCGDDLEEYFFDFPDTDKDACCLHSTDCVAGSPPGKCYVSDVPSSGSSGGAYLCYNNDWFKCTKEIACINSGTHWKCASPDERSWGWYEIDSSVAKFCADSSNEETPQTYCSGFVDCGEYSYYSCPTKLGCKKYTSNGFVRSKYCKQSSSPYSCLEFTTDKCVQYPGCEISYSGSIKTNNILNANYKIIEVSDENGVVSRSESDKFGNLLKVIEAKGTKDEVTARYEYNILGRLIKAINPEGQITTKEYNSIGQVTAETYPDSGKTTFLYDLNGNPIKLVDALGRVIRFEYDKLNRPTKVVWEDYNPKEGKPVIAVEYFYDSNSQCKFKENSIGKICRIKDFSGIIDFKYNEKNQIVEEVKTINGKEYSTKYEYNNAGVVVSMTYPSGKKVFYDYNQLLQLQKTTFLDGKEEKTIISNIEYNPTGSIKSMKYGNNLVTEYDYNNRDWLEKIDSSVFRRFYDYDMVGNVNVMYKDADKKIFLNNYEYDNLYRVTIVKSQILGEQTYAYDKVGNRLELIKKGESKEVYSYETNKNKLQTISKTSLKSGKTTAKVTADNSNLKYDAVGNLVQDDKYKYSYDFENRLIKVTSLTNAVVEEYVYDYLGNRIKKTNTEGTTIYIYDLGSNLIEMIAPPPKPTKIIYKFNKVEQRNPNNYKTCECDTNYRSINCCYGEETNLRGCEPSNSQFESKIDMGAYCVDSFDHPAGPYTLVFKREYVY
ncbi:MAG: hypothetical protein KKB65_06065, partial [Nanoarchaeota archaeon]|nr:hypothetical protein [Nanoarchaeota archaeon]